LDLVVPGGALGVFWCPADGGDNWGRYVAERLFHVLAFPRNPVWIQFAGGEPVLADQTRVMLHRMNQRYRRLPVGGRADHCRYIAISDDTARGIIGASLPRAAEAETFTFGGPYIGIGPDAFYRFKTSIHAAVRDGDAWRGAEATFAMVAHAARMAHAPIEPPVSVSMASGRSARSARPARRNTADARRALVEEAKALIVGEIIGGGDVALAAVAARLHTSPWHLTRTFREVTGVPMHRWLTDVRLRIGLDLLLETDAPITALAHRLGFASHAHLTTSFRALFGRAPSEARAEAKPRKILEARARPAL
jgi:AraC-like DNA-binding protein